MMVTGRSLQVRSLSPTVMEKSSTAGATSGSASVAVTVKVVMPTSVGVPLISPVLASRPNPAGRAPAVTANVAMPVPPAVSSSTVYGVPTLAAGQLGRGHEREVREHHGGHRQGHGRHGGDGLRRWGEPE